MPWDDAAWFTDKKKCIFAVAVVFLMTLQPLLVKLSQNEEGRNDYSPYSVNLLSELGKGVASLLLLAGTSGFRVVEPKRTEVIQYALPGMVYFVNNNLVFLILQSLDATTFQLLGQLKIVFTGLLFRIVLRRKLTEFQYLAIWQLACGATVSQIPEGVKPPGASAIQGMLLSMLSCLLSSLGGIYTEKLMKDKAADSIHWQNLQLYSWGVVFNMVAAAIHAPDVMNVQSFFVGFNAWTAVVIANNTVMGLTLSAILKYADNIARVYTHAIAMLVTMVLSTILFHRHPSMQLVLGIAVVTASAVQYHLRAGVEPTVAGPGTASSGAAAQYKRFLDIEAEEVLADLPGHPLPCHAGGEDDQPQLPTGLKVL